MPGKTYRFGNALLLAALLLAAANMRVGVSSFSPLLEEINKSLQMSDAETGLLNALPYFLFSAVALLARPARGPGLEKSIALAVLLICVGTAARPWAGSFLLFGGTILLSIGIAMGNVLLPALVKRDFPRHVTLLTTTYATLMTLIAALSSGLAVELAAWGAHFPWLPGNLAQITDLTNSTVPAGAVSAGSPAQGSALNWRFSMTFWAVPAVVALLAWLPVLGWGRETKTASKNVAAGHCVWKSPLAWQIGLFLAFVTAGGSAAFTWLPDILESRGMSEEDSGWMLSLYQMVSLLVGISLPLLAARLKSQSSLALASGLICAFGTLGLYLHLPFTWLWVSLTGLGNGAGFILALAFIGLRARDHHEAARLSGMVQGTGYIWGAITPPVLGAIFDSTGSWDIPLLFLILAALAQTWFGSRAGRARYI